MQLWHSPSVNLRCKNPPSLTVHNKQIQNILWEKSKILKILSPTAAGDIISQSFSDTHLFCCFHHSNKKVVLKPHCFDVLKALSGTDYMVTCHQGCDGLYTSCGQFILKCIQWKSSHFRIAPSYASSIIYHLSCKLVRGKTIVVFVGSTMCTSRIKWIMCCTCKDWICTLKGWANQNY